jgi:hypothetical protein
MPKPKAKVTRKEMTMTTNANREYARKVARAIAAYYGDGDTMHAMPWTRDQLSDDELRQWLGSRKHAGQVIDIESCELGRWSTNEDDVYGILTKLGDVVFEGYYVGKNRFVRSPDSNGWVSERDLPPDKRDALHARIRRDSPF